MLRRSGSGSTGAGAGAGHEQEHEKETDQEHQLQESVHDGTRVRGSSVPSIARHNSAVASAQMLEGLTSNPHAHEADETAEKQRARKEQELHSLDKEERAIVPVQAALLTADLTGIGKTHWIAKLWMQRLGFYFLCARRTTGASGGKEFKSGDQVSVDAFSSGGKRKVLIQLSFGWFVCPAAKGALRSHHFGHQRTRPCTR